MTVSSRVRRTVILAGGALAVSLGAFAAAAPAQAHTVMPDTPHRQSVASVLPADSSSIPSGTVASTTSASFCDAQIDENIPSLYGGDGWGHTCGVGYVLRLNNNTFVDAIKDPTTHRRVWFHQTALGLGASKCFFSTGNAIYMSAYTQKYPWITFPGDIYVSNNPYPCPPGS